MLKKGLRLEARMEVSLLLSESQRLLRCLGLGHRGQSCVLLCVSPCLMPARAFLGFLLAGSTLLSAPLRSAQLHRGPYWLHADGLLAGADLHFGGNRKAPGHGLNRENAL